MKSKLTLKSAKTVKPAIKDAGVISPKSDKKLKQTKQKSPTKKSGYLIFSIRKRKEIIDQEPYKSMKQPEIFKVIGQMWKELPSEEQSIFNEEAKRENEKIGVKSNKKEIDKVAKEEESETRDERALSE